MIDPFARALAVLHSAAGSLAAVYIPVDGAPASIRVIMGAPDREISFGRTERVILNSAEFEIQRVDVAMPAEGDHIVVPTGTFILQGEPIGDLEGLSWTIGAEPA